MDNGGYTTKFDDLYSRNEENRDRVLNEISKRESLIEGEESELDNTHLQGNSDRFSDPSHLNETPPDDSVESDRPTTQDNENLGIIESSPFKNKFYKKIKFLFITSRKIKSELNALRNELQNIESEHRSLRELTAKEAVLIVEQRVAKRAIRSIKSSYAGRIGNAQAQLNRLERKYSNIEKDVFYQSTKDELEAKIKSKREDYESFVTKRGSRKLLNQESLVELYEKNLQALYHSESLENYKNTYRNLIERTNRAVVRAKEDRGAEDSLITEDAIEEINETVTFHQDVQEEQRATHRSQIHSFLQSKILGYLDQPKNKAINYKKIALAVSLIGVGALMIPGLLNNNVKGIPELDLSKPVYTQDYVKSPKIEKQDIDLTDLNKSLEKTPTKNVDNSNKDRDSLYTTNYEKSVDVSSIEPLPSHFEPIIDSPDETLVNDTPEETEETEEIEGSEENYDINLPPGYSINNTGKWDPIPPIESGVGSDKVTSVGTSQNFVPLPGYSLDYPMQINPDVQGSYADRESTPNYIYGFTLDEINTINQQALISGLSTESLQRLLQNKIVNNDLHERIRSYLNDPTKAFNQGFTDPVKAAVNEWITIQINQSKGI